MSPEIKNRLLLGFSIFCLIGFMGQSFLLWKTQDQLAGTISSGDDIPASIEKRLLEQLDKRDAARLASSPFGFGTSLANAAQVQNTIDSFFSGFGMPSLPQSSFFGSALSSAVPDISVNETAEDYRIVIPVGPDQELELNTDIEDNSVSVTGTITAKSQSNQNSFSSRTFSQRQFAKTVQFPSPIDEFGMTTHQTESGIEITLPKKHS